MRSLPALTLLACLFTLGACSLRLMALRSLADTVAEPGGVYGRDDDPELVRDALPVMLKLMEQLADALPDHLGVHLALARGFTSYGVAFVQEDADRLHETNVERARPLYLRARRQFLRARDYGLHGLSLALVGFDKSFTPAMLAQLGKKDVPLLYWTGAAWGSAIAVSKDEMELVGEVPRVEALLRRALALDEAWDEGAIHEFFIVFEGGKNPKQAKEHYERARALSKNKKLGPSVTFAEAVLVDRQDKQGFLRLLHEVTSFDVDSDKEHRLANVLAQRRARWLLSRTSDLFAE